MTLAQLYLFTVLIPNIGSTLNAIEIIFVVCAFCCGAGLINAAAECDDDAIKYWRKAALKFVWAIIVVGIISVPIPSEKELYTVAGGYIATNTKDVAKLPDNVVKAANAWLEKAAALADDKSKDAKNK